MDRSKLALTGEGKVSSPLKQGGSIMLHRTPKWARFTLSITLVLLVLSFGITAAHETLLWPTEGWQTSTPEEQGMDSSKLTKMWEALQEPRSDITGTLLIHSLLVIRHGQVVMDASVYPFNSTKPHEAFSLTKSVVSALVGIAIDKGYIKNLDQSIWDFFPKDKTAAMDDRKAAITLRHLMNHTSGLGIKDPELALLSVSGETVVQHLLDSPMLAAPGEAYAYLDGNAHLVSALLQQATELTALEFARNNLFKPLGITNVDWAVDAEGVNFGGAGLAISAQDIARIGYLYLHDGLWNGQQIVSSEWVKQSTNDQLEPLQPHFWEGYSNFWYNGPYGYWFNEPEGKNATHRGYAAIGYAGQILYVMPDLDVIVVTTGDIAYSMVFANGLIDYVIPSIQSETALPANPTGNALLQKAIKASQNPSSAQLAEPPSIASTISNKTYNLPDNKLGWTTVSLDFNSKEEATFHFELNGAKYALPVGLDGVFRVSDQSVMLRDKVIWSHTACPWLIKGKWVESGGKPNFQIELWDYYGQDGFIVSFNFDKTGINAQSILWPEETFSIQPS